MQYELVEFLVCGEDEYIYYSIKNGVSATTNSTLREKESDAEQTTPQATFTRVVGVLFLLSQSSEMRKEVKKPCDSELSDIFCRSREKPHKGGFHAQWHTERKVRGSVEAIRRLADTKLLHSYW